MELLTAAQMRAIERAAIDSGAVTGLELMERAGRGVVEAILDWRPELATTAHRAVVLCGPGNNGGDGFVVARLLKERGWEVEVFLYGDEAKLPPDAAEMCRRWREMGGNIGDARYRTPIRKGGFHLVVDALFGTGLSRPVAPGLAALFDELDVAGPDEEEPCIVSVDVPSGMCADSGRTLDHGPAGGLPSCHLVVTFHRPKLGLFIGGVPHWRVRVVDIGLDKVPESAVRLIDVPAFMRERRWPGLGKSDGHKYSHGHALILSGGPGKGGAARLAARGALRIGAGLVTIGCQPEALAENAARLDAVMLRPVADAAGLADILKDARISTLCLGPGLGVERARALVPVALRAPAVEPGPRSGEGGPGSSPGRRGVVLDADALTAFAGDPPALFAMLHARCVLTPHMGEFGRLFPDLKVKLDEPATKGPAYSKVDAAREAARRAGCIVLLKGADTVIAAPSGRCAINSAHYERAAPWLATAGSGDVLAGFITGLLARGFDPRDAAEIAAWLHVECARKFGPGLIAEDLPEQLPAVFRELCL